jgi:hypothetical protein
VLTKAKRIKKNQTYNQTALGERERERDITWGGARNYISGFEGSQAVPACPSGIGKAYYRNFVIHIY